MTKRFLAVMFVVAIYIAGHLVPVAGMPLVDDALAAGPSAGSSLTVLALEPKSLRRRSHSQVQVRSASVRAGKSTIRVSKKSSKTVSQKSVQLASKKRGRLTNAGAVVVARRSTTVSGRLVRTKFTRHSNAKANARLSRVTLDDALQAPTLETITEDSIAGTRFVRQKSNEPVQLALGASSLPVGSSLKSLIDAVDAGGHVRDVSGNTISLTIDPILQQTAESLLMRNGVPWGAIVAMDPRTGALKAVASYSSHEPNGPEVATRGGFPAASLFKMITTAAGVERAGLAGDDVIAFRGGNYTLGYANYVPDARKDRRVMSLAEALGRSCNPVFARVALNNFSAATLEKYAEKFGFNQDPAFDVPLARSVFTTPGDHYEFARTAAGFGEVTVTPVHAASIIGALANGGVMMRPHLISQVRGKDGELVYMARNMALRSVVRPETAKELMNMMQSTVETGTARRGFHGSFLNNVPIAGKTGTLSGQDPKGVYHWFVAALPANAPEIVISVLVINPGYSRANSVQMGRQFLERAYRVKNLPVESTKGEGAESPTSDGVS